MSEILKLHYDVDGDNFMAAGAASSDVKRVLRQLGIDANAIRKAAVDMYEGEINMVIHAGGGVADITVADDYIEIVLADKGPGIKDIDQAMQAGFSTAPDNIRTLGFGAGMGLPNMKRYTDEMKITTEIGKGTIVDMMVLVK